MRSICLKILLALFASSAAATDGREGQVQIGITRPQNTLADGGPSMQLQKDIKDSINYMAENIDRLASNRAKDKSSEMSGLMDSALRSQDQLKDSVDYDEDTAAEKDLDATREGELEAFEHEGVDKYGAASVLKLSDKEKTRQLEKDSNRKRKAGLSNLENVLNAEDDAEDIAEREEDLQSDDDVMNDESDIKSQIDEEVKDASAVSTAVETEGSKLKKKAKMQVEEANVEHLLNTEDCPPGYKPRSAATAGELASSGRASEQPNEPCPVALADAPCPCIMESFEPLILEKADSTTAAPATSSEALEPDAAGGTQNCEEFLNDVKNHFGDDMQSVTHEDLKPFATNLRKGSTAGIRKISS